jgi:nucleoside-diphosphate-sugar epimerase
LINNSSFYLETTAIANILDKTELTRLLKGTDAVVLLAAEHRDDVSPISLYYDVNVGGMKNTLEAMEANGVKKIIFTSSVAIYGLNKNNPDEEHFADPFNHYGKSKWQAERVLQEWYQNHLDWNINILRPAVIFGERNRGNVYNLLKQISGGKFLTVGKGKNKKSMAYIGNVVAFVKYLIENQKDGYHVFNYIDKPDFTMNELVDHVSSILCKPIPRIHCPYWLGWLGGYCFDILAIMTRRKFSISSVRVKKFCATTQFDSSKMLSSGYIPPYTLGEGLARTLAHEFVHPPKDEVIFVSE